MHILISGESGAGKSTLIGRLIERAEAPVYGFRTERVTDSGSGVSFIYMHPATGEKIYSEDRVVGKCTDGDARAIAGAFDGLGAPLLAGIPSGSIVLMDELGFLESEATRFCEGVLAVMDGPYYAVAAVKAKSTPFIDKVKSHRSALLYNLTMDNRDALYELIMGDLRSLDPGAPFAL